jgi:hypothetical protein
VAVKRDGGGEDGAEDGKMGQRMGRWGRGWEDEKMGEWGKTGARIQKTRSQDEKTRSQDEKTRSQNVHGLYSEFWLPNSEVFPVVFPCFPAYVVGQW